MFFVDFFLTTELFYFTMSKIVLILSIIDLDGYLFIVFFLNWDVKFCQKYFEFQNLQNLALVYNFL